TVTTITDAQLAPKDYSSDQEVRWCPGCGDYAILKAVQKACAELALLRERTVFVSGIGCAARFPYYLSTYGFHTIHGRAPAIATGIKLANPGLDVWVVTGDGDGLSIGGNHMLHVLRRNVDLQIIVFNDGVFDHFTSKDVASDAQLHVEHGKPLLFGRNRERGLRLKPGAVALEVVPAGQGGVPGDILVHDETNRALAQLLAALEPPA